MKISKERYTDLGLGMVKEACEACMFCYEKDNELCCEDIDDMTIDEAIERKVDCPGIDKQRLQLEMTEEEYDAYRHGRLEVE